jgi:hypothetical protein
MPPLSVEWSDEMMCTITFRNFRDLGMYYSMSHEYILTV